MTLLAEHRLADDGRYALESLLGSCVMPPDHNEGGVPRMH